MDHQALLALLQQTKPSQTSLRLAGLDADGARLLASAPSVRGLSALDLRGGYLGDLGAEALTASPHLEALVELRLDQNNLGPKTALSLARTRALPRLTRLSLSGNYLGDDGIRALFHPPRASLWRRLWRWLWPARAPRPALLPPAPSPPGSPYRVAPDVAAAPVHRRRGLPFLLSLDLGWNQLSPDSARAIASSPLLAQLRHLSLQGNRVGEDGALALVTSPYASPFLQLNLLGVGASLACSRALRDRFPGLLLV